MFDLITASLLVALIVLSSIDGLYLHLWKFRLQERPESRREHCLHSVRAVLFLPFLGLFVLQPSGVLLAGLLVLIGIDLLMGLADVLEEQASRKGMGGLSREEYLLHVVLVMLHSMLLALGLAALFLSGAELLPANGLSVFVAKNVVPGTILVGLLHLGLLAYPLGISRLEKLSRSCCSALHRV